MSKKHPVIDAVGVWAELVGAEMHDDGYRFRDWQISSDYKEMMQALEYDPSGLTTFMLVDVHCESFINAKSVSLSEVLSNSESFQGARDKAIRARRVLGESPLREYADYFHEQVGKAMSHYGAERPEVTKMIRDRHSVAILRRDAYQSLSNLEEHVFSVGDPSEGVPRYVRHVHLFWNINSLIRLVSAGPSGVSLNLVRSPDGYQSYFAFVIKTGENLIVLTDRPKWSHPLQGGMTRRPDRRMDERIAKNRFPYSLMDITRNEKGDLRLNRSRDLVAMQEEWIRLKEIGELEPDETVWVAMMLGLIVEKYWRKRPEPKNLAYVAANAVSGLPVPLGSHRMKLPRVTMAEMRAEKLDQFRNSTRFRAHLEGRFDHLFDDSLLNLTVAATDDVLYLPASGNTADSVTTEEPSRHNYPGEPIILHGLDLTVFESEERLRADQLYIARYNYAKLVKRELEREFVETEKEVCRWYIDRVRANFDMLVEAIRRGELLSTTSRTESFSFKEFDQVVDIFRLSESRLPAYRHELVFSRRDNDYDAHRCYFTGAAPSYVVEFSPYSADGIAKIVGCTVEELPEPIRHYNRSHRYNGNSILDRIDPLEWVVHDIWEKRANFTVSIVLSKRALNRIRKGKKADGTDK